MSFHLCLQWFNCVICLDSWWTSSIVFRLFITSITGHFLSGSLYLYKTTAGLSAWRGKVLSRWNCLIPSVLTLFLSTSVETIMARSSKGNAQNHIEPCEWAQIFIQDELKYSHEISCQNGKLPIKGHFDTNSRPPFPMITDDEESENDPDPCRVKIRNIVTTESSVLKDINSKLDGFLSQKDGATVLHHCTDRRSAINIFLGQADRTAILAVAQVFILPRI